MGLSLPLSLIFVFYLVQSTVNNCSVKSLMTGFEPRSFCKRYSGYWAWTHERKRTILTLTLSLSLSFFLSLSLSILPSCVKYLLWLFFLKNFLDCLDDEHHLGGYGTRLTGDLPFLSSNAQIFSIFWIMMFAYNFTGRKVPARKMCKC